MIEIFNYLDDLNSHKYESLQTLIKELDKILKYTINKQYDIDIDSIF
jgi:hypothetical protein